MATEGYTITCGQCGAKMRVRDVQPGRQFACRRCQCRFVIPATDDSAEDTQADRIRQRRLIHVAVFSGIGLVLVLALVIGGSRVLGTRSVPQPAGQPAGDDADHAQPAQTQLEIARQYVREIYGPSMDRVGRTPETQDDVQLADRFTGEADRFKRQRQPLVAALLFAHAARLLANSGGHYPQACEALDESVSAVLAFNADPKFRVSEVDQAQRALDAAPEAATQPHTYRRPEFFGDHQVTPYP